MKKQTAIVLLGVDFDEHVVVTDLVRILKKCNRNLNIILVADKVPRVLERTVRQEGIFYHAFRPFNTEGREELRLVVECAFHNSPQAGLV
jgi:hypothetical protein